jgi:Tat protein translocase TatC
MATSKPDNDELAGTEQPFVTHLVELRNRLIYSVYGIAAAVALLAIWPGPSGLIDLIAMPIRAHMPPGTKLIAVGVFSPFFVPLKVLTMCAVLLVLPWLMYQMWAFVAPGLYSHEKRFALPLIVFGSFLAYTGIAFVQFFVLDKMFAFIQGFTPESVAATPDIASYVAHCGDAPGAFGHGDDRKAQSVSRLFHRAVLRDRCGGDAPRRDFPAGAGHSHVPALRGGHPGCALVRQGVQSAGASRTRGRRRGCVMPSSTVLQAALRRTAASQADSRASA